MSDINKRIHENAAKLAKVKAGACGTCGGYGETAKNGGIDESGDMIATNRKPCPTCAKLRRIIETHSPEWARKPIKGREHLREPHCSENVCSICGISEIKGTNRHQLFYTVQSMRQLLEDLDEWEGFKDDLFASLLQKILGTIDYRVAEAMKKFADILTSDPDMRQAVDSYLEHRVGEVA